MKLNEADSGQLMDDQTAIDVYERDKYSEDHREDRDGDGDAPKGSPIEHDATLTDWWEIRPGPPRVRVVQWVGTAGSVLG
jgi:hypothetical protein